MKQLVSRSGVECMQPELVKALHLLQHIKTGNARFKGTNVLSPRNARDCWVYTLHMLPLAPNGVHGLSDPNKLLHCFRVLL